MGESLMTRPQVQLRTGLSRTRIYERIKAGTFPAPRREPGCASVRWLESEIDAWIAAWVSRSVVAGTVAGTESEATKKPLESAA